MVRAARPGSRWAADRSQRREAYDRYMKSAKWAARRRIWLDEEARRTGRAAVCAVCGSDVVELHHLDYTHLGHEHHDDLRAVCPAHHKALHDIWDASYIWRRAGRRAASLAIIQTMHAQAQ